MSDQIGDPCKVCGHPIVWVDYGEDNGSLFLKCYKNNELEEMINEARKWAFDIVSRKFAGVQLGFVPNEPIVPMNLPTSPVLENTQPEHAPNG